MWCILKFQEIRIIRNKSMADGHIDQQLHLSGIRTELWPLEAGDNRDHIKPSNHTRPLTNPPDSFWF